MTISVRTHEVYEAVHRFIGLSLIFFFYLYFHIKMPTNVLHQLHCVDVLAASIQLIKKICRFLVDYIKVII